MKIIIGILFFLFSLLFSRESVYAADSAFAPEEIIVKFNMGVSTSQIGKINDKFGAIIKEKLNLPSTPTNTPTPLPAVSTNTPVLTNTSTPKPPTLTPTPLPWWCRFNPNYCNK